MIRPAESSHESSRSSATLLKLNHIQSVAKSEPIGSRLFFVHAGLLVGSGSIAAFLFDSWNLLLVVTVYVVVLSLEKSLAMWAYERRKAHLQPLVLGLLLTRAVTYNVLVVLVWLTDIEVFQHAALALLVAATINIFVFHATYPVIIACVVGPIWLAFAVLSAIQFISQGFTSESVASAVILGGITPYFLLALLHARNRWQQLDDTRSALAHLQQQNVLGRLVSGVAHDFNNILGVTLGTAELMKSASKSESEKYANQIIKAAEQGAALTQQLLAFSGEAILHPEPVSLRVVFDDMKPMLERVIPESIHITFSVPDNLPKANVDVQQLKTALLNLAINSRDAMPSGGQLDFRCGKAGWKGRTFFIGDRRLEGEFAGLSVTDTGQGIPRDLQSVVFDPFYTTKTGAEGSGLGLAMVKGFATQSGGAVEVSSAAGRGTTIRLYLPVAVESASKEKQPINSSKPSAMHNERVLLVEDNIELRSVLESHLSSAGYLVSTSSSGDAAYASLSNGLNPDILITDLVMPGQMQGEALADAVRRKYGAIPVIFISGYREISSIGSDREVDPPILRKPISRRALLEVLDSVTE